jgi:hypothetical protein
MSNSPPYRRAPAHLAPRTTPPPAQDVTARDVAILWLVLGVASIVRLAIAFARGEGPLGAFPISEPGFAFVILLFSTPRAARLLKPSRARERAEASLPGGDAGG